MPRQKKSHSRSVRNDPVGLGAGELEPSREFPLFEKLESARPEEREEACNALANIVLEDSLALDLFLDSPTFLVLVQHLRDPVSAVRVSAAGALRNISLVGGPKATEKLATSDCVETVIHTLLESSNLDVDVTALLVQEVALLANLCESSDSILLQVLQQGMEKVLALFVEEKCGQDLRLQLGQLLLVVTDDIEERNVSCISQYIQQLATMFSNPTLHSPHLRALLATVLVNLGCSSINTELMETCVMPTIELTLDFDGVKALEQLQSMEPTQGTELLNIWHQTVAAQQLCLENLANLCSFLDAYDENIHKQGSVSHLPSYLQRDHLAFRLVEKTASRCYLDKKLLSTLLGASQPRLQICGKALQRVQISALQCIGNLLLILGPLEPQAMGKLWALFCQLCEESFAAQQVDLLEILTGNMWTLLRTIPSAAESPVVATPGLLEGLIHLANHGSVELRTNTIGMLGFLGQQLHEPAVIKLVAQTLCTGLVDALDHKNILKLQMLVEVLNAIFDIFAETQHNGCVSEVQMMDKLHSALAFLIQMEQGSYKGVDEDLKNRLEDTLSNLTNFIEYKTKQF